MDLIIVFLTICFMFFVFRNTFNIFDVVVTLDLFLRGLNWALNYVPRTAIVNKLDMFFPDSILDIINSETMGGLNDVLTIIYFLAYALAVILIIKRIVRRKR